MKEILGPGSDDLVVSEDQVQDKNRAAEFAAKAKEKMSVEVDAKMRAAPRSKSGRKNGPFPSRS